MNVRGPLGLLFLTLSLAAASPAAAMPAPIDGIPCDEMEGGAVHLHAHLSVIERGSPVVIPEDVGQPLGGGCAYWLHTHRTDGVIHVESPVVRSFTLGEFIDVWGPHDPNLADAGSPEPRRVWVDGTVYTGPLHGIVLRRHTDVVIEVGEPFFAPTPFTDWRGL